MTTSPEAEASSTKPASDPQDDRLERVHYCTIRMRAFLVIECV
jgi:hypothetical protein